MCVGELGFGEIVCVVDMVRCDIDGGGVCGGVEWIGDGGGFCRFGCDGDWNGVCGCEYGGGRYGRLDDFYGYD